MVATTTATIATNPDDNENDVNGNKSYENVSIRAPSKQQSKKEKDSSSSSTSSASSSSTSVDEVDLQNNNKVDLRNPYSGILMEIDELKIDAAKEDDLHVNKPKPAPRNRTKHQGQPQPTQYENTEIRRSRSGEDEIDTKKTPQIVISSSTGAIKKQPNRTAPPRPPSPVFKEKTPETKPERPQNTFVGGEKLNRSSSSNTLDSSQDGSEASSKYKTSSPGQVKIHPLCSLNYLIYPNNSLPLRF